MDDLNPLLKQLVCAALSSMAPPPRISVSEWAERFRILSREGSAQPGPWMNHKAPHLVAPMNALGPYHPAKRVVLKCGTQSGKTEILLNFLGYTIDCDPGPALVIQPNVTPMAERFSKQRVAPMFRDCPTLFEKIGKSRGADSQNTITEKSFPGGILFIGGSNSPAGLSSMPIRYLLCDELGRWEVTKEGDSLALARERLETFYNLGMSKELTVSSPTYSDIGISAEYNRCSQQWEWHLVCEHCGESQFPRLKHFNWGNKPELVSYSCSHCGSIHESKHQDRIKANGIWVCVKDEGPHSIGFWHNKWASPFARWETVAQKWHDAGNDHALRQVQVNTSFAEDWEGEGEKVEPSLLSQRAEDWGDNIPSRVQIITIGCDVQGDRLEVETVGWGPNRESWSLAYDVLPGEPTAEEVWQDLLDVYRQTWTRDDGQVLKPSILCVDSGAYTQHVYSFVKRAKERGIVPIKGVAGMAREPLAGDRRQRLKRASHRMREGRPPEILGVDNIKLTSFRYLSAPPGQVGYCHFPHGRSEEYYLQLTGERLMVVSHKGRRAERRWVPIHPAVEALDCRVYAYAALLLSSVDLVPATPKAKPADEAQPAPPPPLTPLARPSRQRRTTSSSGFAPDGWAL